MKLANTEQIVDALLRFELDVGFIEGHARHPDLLVYPWREDTLVVVAHPDHRLAGRRGTPDQLAGETWVLRESGSGTREVFERAIGPHFALQRAPIEFGGPEAIKRAVRAGLGVACTSKAVVAEDIAARRLKPVYTPWMDLRRDLTVLLHRHKFCDRSLTAFLKVCGVDQT
jgi:DNA-binding transcriptional LysR family regulator